MKITTEEVLHVANLARLEIPNEEIDTFAGQIATILEYIEMLNRIDTDGVPPTSHVLPLTNAFREDRTHEHLDLESVLANAPEKEDGNFLVPKVIV